MVSFVLANCWAVVVNLNPSDSKLESVVDDNLMTTV